MITIAEKIVEIDLPKCLETRTTYKEEIRKQRNCYMCLDRSQCSEYTKRLNKCMRLDIQKDMYQIIDFFSDISKIVKKSKKEGTELIFKIKISSD